MGGEVFVIGGAEIYRQASRRRPPYITEVDAEPAGDASFRRSRPRRLARGEPRKKWARGRGQCGIAFVVYDRPPGCNHVVDAVGSPPPSEWRRAGLPGGFICKPVGTCL